MCVTCSQALIEDSAMSCWMVLHRLVMHGILTVPIVCVLMVLLAVARLKPKSAICKAGSVSSSHHESLIDILIPAMQIP